MELTEDGIKEAIADGTITAITLDTSVFDGNGNRFERGLLARLSQFSGTAIHVVLSDVVVAEVKGHVTREAAEAQAKIRANLKEVAKSWQISQEQRDAAMAALFGVESPEQLAERRLAAFIAATSLITVESAGRVDIAGVLEAYFSVKPPFGQSISKKSEFPDAFALQALEHWAQAEGRQVLVVSRDGDWQRYCKESRYLVVSDDLAKALSYFHQNAEVACARLAERFNDGGLSVEDNIRDAVCRAIDRLTFMPEVSSGYFFDADVYDVTVLSIRVEEDAGSPFKIVDKPEENILVVEAEVEVLMEVAASFEFSVTDPIDKDEVPIGSASATSEVSMDIKVLLTFEGDLSQDAELVEVEVEMDSRSIEVDYGEVGPDWGPDPDDE